MYEADLEKSGILEKCPYKSRKKRIEWLLEYLDDMNNPNNEEFPCYEPNDIIIILKWLNLCS